MGKIKNDERPYRRFDIKQFADCLQVGGGGTKAPPKLAFCVGPGAGRSVTAASRVGANTRIAKIQSDLFFCFGAHGTTFHSRTFAKLNGNYQL